MQQSRRISSQNLKSIPLCLAIIAAALGTTACAQDPPQATTDIATAEGEFLGNIRQVTFGLPRAGEGYFSPDGSTIVYQAFPVDYPFYQIYVQGIDDLAGRMISTGKGRTTCAFFAPEGDRILFASAHTRPDLEAAERQARDEAAAGTRRRYQWDFDPYMEIYVQERGSSELKPLTNSEGYDAEGSYSHDGAHIVFTSTRDGDPDLYIMDADGSNVRQLTNADGYDGGPFFSPDDQWVIFRSDRQEKDMLQIYAISADGEHEVQLTDNLATVNWAPFFHPSGKYIVWTQADYSRGPMFANFDLFTMDVSWTDDTFSGGNPRRITFHEKADVLPVFSPDGSKLMWTSSRTEDGSSQLWMADWIGGR